MPVILKLPTWAQIKCPYPSSEKNNENKNWLFPSGWTFGQLEEGEVLNEKVFYGIVKNDNFSK